MINKLKYNKLNKKGFYPLSSCDITAIRLTLGFKNLTFFDKTPNKLGK